MVALREYLDEQGASPCAKWFASIDARAAAKVATAMVHIERGNFSNVKGVGSGVLECVIDFGPGYRVYLAKDGEKVVILLGGGSKKRQQKDIDAAKALWAEYKKHRKKAKK